jgi:hypothetical protein
MHLSLHVLECRIIRITAHSKYVHTKTFKLNYTKITTFSNTKYSGIEHPPPPRFIKTFLDK